VYYKNLKNYQLPTFQMPKWSLGDSKPIEKPSLSPLAHTNKTLELEEEVKDDDKDKSTAAPPKPQEEEKKGPSFHFLVSLSTSPADYCKSILSALLNNYPPPTIIQASNTFANEDHARASPDLEKILGVKEYLYDSKHVADDDLILIIEGFGTWFQLPSDVLIAQYQRILETANAELKETYGTKKVKKVDRKGKKTTETVPRFNQSIVFGAEKLCRPNSDRNTACKDAPASTLDLETYGEVTDKDSEGYKHRPKYLEAGTIIGSASALRAFYDAAYQKALKNDRSQQYIFAEMFGEQEKARRIAKKHGSSSSSSGYEVDDDGNVVGKKETEDEDEDEESQTPVEFGMGLDYYGFLWQTTSRLADDEIDFLSHDRSKRLKTISSARPLHPNLNLPKALSASLPPYGEPEGNTQHTVRSDSRLVRRTKADHIPAESDWQSVPLAQNTYTGSVPAALVFPELEAAADHTASLKTDTDASHAGTPGHAHTTNSTDAANTDWWPRMWFYPHARAMLRRTLRWPKTEIVVGKGKSKSAWRVRGGRGGVWVNSGKEWLSWGEMCPSVEDDVFQDGKGKWSPTGSTRRRS
jgi:hypothetical protein